MALSRSVTWVSTLGRRPPGAELRRAHPGPAHHAERRGLQKVYSIAQGAELRLPWSLKARVTGFFDADRDVSDFVATCGASLACTSVASVDGSTYGLELLVERALTRRLGGWLSYTLSRAERVLDNARVSVALRPHPRAVGGRSLRPRPGLRRGLARHVLHGPSRTSRPRRATTALPRASDQRRLPDYYRFDARLDKRWDLGGGEWVTVVAEFFDATLTKEAVDYKCNFLTRLCAAEYVGPIALPSIGLEGGW